MLLCRRIPIMERLEVVEHFPECTVRIFKDIHKRHRIVAYRTKQDTLGYCGVMLSRHNEVVDSVGEEKDILSLLFILRGNGYPVYGYAYG